MKKKKSSLIAIALATAVGLGAAGNINQATADNSQNVNMNANVNNNCSLKDAVPVTFGQYDPIIANASTPLNAAGTFGVKCNAKGSTTLTIDNGQNSAHASGTTRAMAGTLSDYLSYDLYTTSGYTTVWNATNTVTYGPAANGNEFTETVYGQIPAGQVNTRADSYSDTVIVTATY